MTTSMVRRLSWVNTNRSTSPSRRPASATTWRTSGGQCSLLNPAGILRANSTCGGPPRRTASSVAGRAAPPV